MSMSLRTRHGLTAIELVIVISVIALLSSMSIPSLLKILRRGSINQAGESIVRIAQEAQRRARHGSPPTPALATPHFGVAVVQEPGNRPYAVLLYGVSEYDELMEGGNAIRRSPLGKQAVVHTASGASVSAPLSGRIAWFYAYGTGRPIESPTNPTPINIGTRAQAGIALQTGTYQVLQLESPAVPASPVCSELSVRSHDGRLGVAVAIYSIGLHAVSGASNP